MGDSSDSVSSDSAEFSSTEPEDNSTSVVSPVTNQGFASLAQAVESESDKDNGLFSTDGDSNGDHVMISLSTNTLENLWALVGVVVLVNIGLCVWCQCKRNAATKPQQRFVSDDPYESEVNANV